MSIPNILSLSRIFFSFLILLISNIYINYNDIYIFKIIIYIIVLITIFTDFLDGIIARKYNLISNLGKLIDPIADKIFVITIFIIFTTINIAPNTTMINNWIVVVIIARDLLITGLRNHIALNSKIIIAANNIGKIKTILQMIIILFGFNIWLNIIPKNTFVIIIWYISIYFLIIITLLSGIVYFINNYYMISKK